MISVPRELQLRRIGHFCWVDPNYGLGVAGGPSLEKEIPNLAKATDAMKR